MIKGNVVVRSSARGQSRDSKLSRVQEQDKSVTVPYYVRFSSMSVRFPRVVAPKDY